MKPLTTDAVTLWVDASAHRLYEMVADVTRTPEWSPEITRCEWLDGADGPAVGARFKSWNRVSGLRWTNKPVVEVADPGCEFTFSRAEPMGGTLRWRYRFTPTEGGTTVEESYEVTRRIGRPLYLLFRLQGGHRAADMRRGMQMTLRRLKAAAEDASSPSDNQRANR